MSRQSNGTERVADTEQGREFSSYGNDIPVVQADGHVRRLEAIEADIIRLAVRHYGGQMSEVARRLGIGRSTLYRKLAELNVHVR